MHDLAVVLPDFREIRGLPDGSMEITTDSIANSIQAVEMFVKKIEHNLLSTPDFTYRLPNKSAKGWMSAVYGCIGIIIAKSFFGDERKTSWGIITKVPGIYIGNYTLIFYDNYAKIIHPIRSGNSVLRQKIEKEVASVLTTMAKRIDESQPGYEGVSMLSVVTEKTGLEEKEIVEIINSKVFESKERSATSN